SVRVGRIKLIEHESETGLKPGGHTLAKHVGLSEQELRERLTDVSRASSFYNQDVAEQVISKALKANKIHLENWAKYSLPEGMYAPIEYVSKTPIGFGVTKGSKNIKELYTVRIVLNYSEYNGKPFYILTAYPKG
ncbi:RNase A-like domain-containing protein, partial [Photorhabdus viridis]|uniref:RNase A-like domain-containing protein n=1 Tax=Photorhabdus viridis TaxID=3163327 RepID=UPI0033070C4B